MYKRQAGELTLTALPDVLAVRLFKGPTSKVGRGRGKGKGEENESKGEDVEGWILAWRPL